MDEGLPIFSVGDCPVTPGLEVLYLVLRTDTETPVFFCPYCGGAWSAHPDSPDARMGPLSELAPFGVRLPTPEEVAALWKGPVEPAEEPERECVIGDCALDGRPFEALDPVELPIEAGPVLEILYRVRRDRRGWWRWSEQDGRRILETRGSSPVHCDFRLEFGGSPPTLSVMVGVRAVLLVDEAIGTPSEGEALARTLEAFLRSTVTYEGKWSQRDKSFRYQFSSMPWLDSVYGYGPQAFDIHGFRDLDRGQFPPWLDED